MSQKNTISTGGDKLQEVIQQTTIGDVVATVKGDTTNTLSNNRDDANKVYIEATQDILRKWGAALWNVQNGRTADHDDYKSTDGKKNPFYYGIDRNLSRGQDMSEKAFILSLYGLIFALGIPSRALVGHKKSEKFLDGVIKYSGMGIWRRSVNSNDTRTKHDAVVEQVSKADIDSAAKLLGLALSTSYITLEQFKATLIYLKFLPKKTSKQDNILLSVISQLESKS